MLIQFYLHEIHNREGRVSTSHYSTLDVFNECTDVYIWSKDPNFAQLVMVLYQSLKNPKYQRSALKIPKGTTAVYGS